MMPKTPFYKIYFLVEGTHTDSSNQVEVHDKEYLDSIINSYEPELFEASAVIGHDEDLEAIYKNDRAPSYGWVKKLGRDSKGVYAMTEVAPEFSELLDRDVPPYKYISAAIYDINNPFNPKKGKAHYLRHLAFLGATPPAIKGLPKMVKFGECGGNGTEDLIQVFNKNLVEKYEDDNYNYNHKKNNMTTMPVDNEALLTTADAYAEDSSTSEVKIPDQTADPAEISKFLDDHAKDFLIYVLKDGELGYAGEINRFEPEPSADNDYLYDADAEKFAGVFYDDSSAEVGGFEFEISKTADGWMSYYIPVEREIDSYEEAEVQVADADADADADAEVIEITDEELGITATSESESEDDANVDAEADDETAVTIPIAKSQSQPTKVVAGGVEVEIGGEAEAEAEAEVDTNGTDSYEEAPQLSQSDEMLMAQAQLPDVVEAEAEVPTSTEVEVEVDSDDSDLATEVELMREEAKTLRQEVLRLKTEINDMKLSEFRAYAEAKSGLLSGTSFSTDKLAAMLTNLELGDTGLKAYSEKNGEGITDSVKRLLTELEDKMRVGSIMTYGEMPFEDEIVEDNDPEPAAGTSYDPASLAVHREVLKYCEQNGLASVGQDYLNAYKAVISKSV